jgi:hypothetical protein
MELLVWHGICILPFILLLLLFLLLITAMTSIADGPPRPWLLRPASCWQAHGIAPDGDSHDSILINIHTTLITPRVHFHCLAGGKQCQLRRTITGWTQLVLLHYQMLASAITTLLF